MLQWIEGQLFNSWKCFLGFQRTGVLSLFLFFFFPLVLHSRHASFPKQKVFFMNVQTLLSYCQCVYLQCRERKVVYLPICVRMCCLRAYSQQWICRACSVLFAASGGHASGWLLPKRNFDGLNVPWMQAVPPQLDQQSQVNRLSLTRSGWSKGVTTLFDGEMKALLTFSSLGGWRVDFC